MIIRTETDTNGVTYEMHEERHNTQFGRAWDYYVKATAGKYSGFSMPKRVFSYQTPGDFDYPKMRDQAREDLFINLQPELLKLFSAMETRSRLSLDVVAA